MLSGNCLGPTESADETQLGKRADGTVENCRHGRFFISIEISITRAQRMFDMKNLKKPENIP